jgi:hypothetical protein
MSTSPARPAAGALTLWACVLSTAALGVTLLALGLEPRPQQHAAAGAARHCASWRGPRVLLAVGTAAGCPGAAPPPSSAPRRFPLV